MPKDRSVYGAMQELLKRGGNYVADNFNSHFQGAPGPMPTPSPSPSPWAALGKEAGRVPAVNGPATAEPQMPQSQSAQPATDGEPVLAEEVDPLMGDFPLQGGMGFSSSQTGQSVLTPQQFRTLSDQAYSDPMILSSLGKQAELDKQVEKFKGIKPQLDLTPLMAFVDDQTGSKFTNSYKPPIRPEELMSEVAKQMSLAQASRAKIGDMIAEQMKLGKGETSGRSLSTSMREDALVSRYLGQFKNNKSVDDQAKRYANLGTVWKLLEDARTTGTFKVPPELVTEIQQLLRQNFGTTGGGTSTGAERNEIYVRGIKLDYNRVKQYFTGNISGTALTPDDPLFMHLEDLTKRELLRTHKFGNQLIDKAGSGMKTLFYRHPDYLPDYRDVDSSMRTLFTLPDSLKPRHFIVDPSGRERIVDDESFLTPKKRKELESQGFKIIQKNGTR